VCLCQSLDRPGDRVELRGPIPEFLAKKRAEQARGTTLAYEVVFGAFLRFCDGRGVRTVGQVTEPVAHAFIDAERAVPQPRGAVNTAPGRSLSASKPLIASPGPAGSTNRHVPPSPVAVTEL
jgi:hypothetical protein